MSKLPKYTVFYDGGCGLCQRSVAVLRALDWLRRFRYATLRSAEARAAGISSEQSPAEMMLLTPSGSAGAGRLWGGWRGVKRICLRLPVFYLVITALLFLQPWLGAAILMGLTPLGNPPGDWLYRLVARNRRRWPASTCSLENR